MEWIEAGWSGAYQTPDDDAGTSSLYPRAWPPLWRDLVPLLLRGHAPRPIQKLALGLERGRTPLWSHRRHLLVSAPTNGGKSFVGMLPLLEAIAGGKRAILVEPLRALAREQHEEWRDLARPLKPILGHKLRVRLATGDTRLEGDSFAAPPPGGELLIATPERLDAILRQPGALDWFRGVGAVTIDEAHLLGQTRRGATLETVITSLLRLPLVPRVSLLSATFGTDAEATWNLERWLSPCEVLSVTERFPPLEKRVLRLEAGDDPNAAVLETARGWLAEPRNSLLIFVYQTRAATALAQKLTEELGVLTGMAGAYAYHANLGAATRQSVRQNFETGLSRVLVSTTALGQGVNLPATHVLVRDTIFPGVGALSTGEALQMLGRAGRGERTGVGVVLARRDEDAAHWAQALRDECVAPLRSQLIAPQFARKATKNARPAFVSPPPDLAVWTLSLLNRAGQHGMTRGDLGGFLARTLAAIEREGQNAPLGRDLQAAFDWLSDPLHGLVWSEGSDPTRATWRATVLGQKIARGSLPLSLGVGVAMLLRDFLACDPDDRWLGAWRPLDWSLLLHLHGFGPMLRPLGAPVTQIVEARCAEHPLRVPLLWREWGKDDGKARELCGSLGLKAGEKGARSHLSSALFHALIWQRQSEGAAPEQLESEFGITQDEGAFERWRDEWLWLLGGLAQLLEVRAFYFHLREVCEADGERVKNVKGQLRRLRLQLFGLCQNAR